MEMSDSMRRFIEYRVQQLKAEGLNVIEIEAKLSYLVDSGRELRDIIRAVFGY